MLVGIREAESEITKGRAKQGKGRMNRRDWKKRLLGIENTYVASPAPPLRTSLLKALVPPPKFSLGSTISIVPVFPCALDHILLRKLADVESPWSFVRGSLSRGISVIASYASRSSSNADLGEEGALALASPRTVMTEGVSDTLLLCFNFLYAVLGTAFNVNFFNEGKPTPMSGRDSTSESPESEEAEPVSEIRDPISTEKRLLLRLRFMLGEIDDSEI